MTIWRVLATESLKMKRSIALKLAILAPAAVVLLAFFMAANAPFSTINRGGSGKEWISLSRLVFLFWAALMMPLYIALDTALVAGLDHSENHWKSLLARPVPRWTWYISKLIVVVAMLIFSALLLVCGTLVAGLILPRVQRELSFGFPIPWEIFLRQSAQIMALAFLQLSILHWVSLRWRAFSVAIGVGILATVVGYVSAMVTFRVSDWPQYFPWALPMLVLSPHSQDAIAALWISFVAGLLVATAGCIDFCRREVS